MIRKISIIFAVSCPLLINAQTLDSFVNLAYNNSMNKIELQEKSSIRDKHNKIYMHEVREL